MTKIPRVEGAELVGVFKHDSPEWHAQRAAVVGSSDVAAILGLSPWKSAYTVWQEKQGHITPAEPSPQMKRKYAYGHHMEPFVADLWEEQHPGLALGITGSWRNKERPWQGCNPDRLVYRTGPEALVELKTFNYAADWADIPPQNYVVQLKWQLDVFGYRRGWLAGYANVSGEYVEHEIELNDFEAEITRQTVKNFLDSLTPPDIDGSVSTYETLRRLNPSLNRGVEVEIPADVADAYLEAMNDEKRAASEALKWKGHLLAHMGAAQWATYGGTRIASRVARGDNVPYLKEA